MSEVIVVTSGKGGVGKTTTAANIGIGLAQLGKKVVMVDTDIGLRNLDVVLGLENRIVYNLVDVIESNCRMKQALIKDKRFDDQLYLLPSAQTRDKTSVTPEQMKKLIDDIRDDFDFILLDCPAIAFWNPCSIPAGQSSRIKSKSFLRSSTSFFICSGDTLVLSLVCAEGRRYRSSNLLSRIRACFRRHFPSITSTRL